MSKLVVFGGSGFLGKRICQAGIDAGLNVVSFSRSGSPPKKAGVQDVNWISKVHWKSANIFKPETYKDELKDARGVVHSVGILLENQDYKARINSNSSVLTEFAAMLKPSLTSNPMAKDPFNTYDSINRDSAILLAETFHEVSEEKLPFVYISADKGFPMVPTGYIRSKREAEAEIAQIPNLRSIFMRPGFMYDEEDSDSVRHGVKKAMDVLGFANTKVLGGTFDQLIRPTVSTQTVARCVVDKLFDPEATGVVSLDEIIRT